MKKCSNKLFALGLALSMLISLFTVVSASAESENVLPDGWKVVSEDFEDAANIQITGNALKTDMIGSNWNSNMTVGTTSDPANAESGNTVLKLTPNAAGSRYRIVANDFSSAYFTLTFDFYFASESTKDYNGFHVSADGDDYNHIFQVWDRQVPVRGYHHCSSAVSNAASGDILEAGNWYSAKLVRVGTTVTFQLCKKNAPESLLYNATSTYDCLTATKAPGIMFTRSSGYTSTDPSIYLDNYRLENTTGDVNCVGAQVSAASAGKYAVRFVGTLNTEAYEKAGFEIVASYGDSQTKTFKLDTCEGYTGILASNGNEFFRAEDLGGKLLIALSIKNIPVSAGNITFTVKAVAYAEGASDPVTSETVSVCATVSGDTVTLVKA